MINPYLDVQKKHNTNDIASKVLIFEIFHLRNIHAKMMPPHISIG